MGCHDWCKCESASFRNAAPCTTQLEFVFCLFCSFAGLDLTEMYKYESVADLQKFWRAFQDWWLAFYMTAVLSGSLWANPDGGVSWDGKGHRQKRLYENQNNMRTNLVGFSSEKKAGKVHGQKKKKRGNCRNQQSRPTAFCGK